ncbi:hypothetical protein DPMN_121478 [Dreissena polymorpha]|uniref:Uncharacterized protein n=1 Tax=Dreissena polymorpha TaxID=45954 RepID=A0A9D4GQT2_DREPO|nr:hypothetical protein DPMN_121478 [Dreissena polymorpha]
MKSSHKRCSVEQCGLVISMEFDYLETFSDRIFLCACHGKRVIEVKWPYILVDSSRTINSLDFLNEDDIGHFTLKGHGNTYYDQIAGL